ncbi:MAG: 1,4-dihydroxy-6-naphthoate synthase [Candidatus Loosdrechtia sp.]|uniref:1,4-dihydroxy-6-naphthoate synthase n=1 Tax=Candidatus Loosdrechtia sp. TaxID=3101272 RepID=UPI003A6CF57B|nr:MAG: 1,4-dihydroxy-6-naphthoate synthase [Candidatus Jettenia sp. AMX2]
MKLTLGFSPCPNDTFIFDALANRKIDTEGLSFELIITDVEELNRLAFQHSLDITKLSYYACAHLIKDYRVLPAGSALGNNCGPLLITRPEKKKLSVEKGIIAIPGKYTTAHFLLNMAFPGATHKTEMRFSDIEEAVLQNKADAGVIIHENRFTYQDKGLIKILDLGEYWEQQTKLPIPLGGIVIKREISPALSQKVNRIVRRSVEYALANPASSKAYVKHHARELDEHVRNQHIQLYVNNYTVNLGETGKRAVKTLFKQARINSLIPGNDEGFFLPDG